MFMTRFISRSKKRLKSRLPKKFFFFFKKKVGSLVKACPKISNGTQITVTELLARAHLHTYNVTGRDTLPESCGWASGS